ncbi:protein IQ-DOMAIN 33-like [Vicia villosa]|uniref:protein IQ-DOMAIN 33-like n=1 Tax=Vicia villosa TaxID=3911 RepID=UPI00273C9C71|nr:protein IQ-DOMAIN 33-like [Vicia villosa]
MGFTVGLVRNVFSRNHAIRSHESKIMRRNSTENRRWISVKSYLCGNEFNSVLAEEDSASFKSSEITVTQSLQEDFATDKEDTKSEETVENAIEKKPNSNHKSLNEEEAAIIIQSAYKSFKLRRKNEEIIRSETREEKLDLVTESPDRKSMATSVEVQAGNSTEVFSVEGENMSIYNHIQNRNRTRGIKQKEDWDDSTVSSNVSKMRMQNRMEATTRRERALAYAFSQQLRICSKRKLAKHNSMEQNVSWSWLERWMATRIQDTASVESHAMNQYENFTNDHKITIKTRFLDGSGGEEKESCGSNEVPIHYDNYSISSQEEKVSNFKLSTTKTNFKAKRTVSRRKTVPSYQFHDEHSKVSIKDGLNNASKDIKPKLKQDGRKTELSQMTISTPKTSNE